MRSSRGGGIMKRSHRGGIMEGESWRNHGRGITEES